MGLQIIAAKKITQVRFLPFVRPAGLGKERIIPVTHIGEVFLASMPAILAEARITLLYEY